MAFTSTISASRLVVLTAAASLLPLALISTAQAQPTDLRSRISNSQLKNSAESRTEKALVSEAARLREAETALLKQASVNTKVQQEATRPDRKTTSVISKSNVYSKQELPEAEEFKPQHPDLAKRIQTLEAGHEEQKKALTIQISNLEKTNDALTTKLQQYEEENERLKEELTRTKEKAKSELQKVDDLHVRLMVSETQVERLNKIIEGLGGSSPALKRKFNAVGATQKTPYPSIKGSAESPLYATVTALRANIRTGPGLANTQLTTLERGEQVLVESKQGEWYKVLLNNGIRAWVNASVVRIGPERNPIEVAPREPRLDDVDQEALRLLEQLKK